MTPEQLLLLNDDDLLAAIATAIKANEQAIEAKEQAIANLREHLRVAKCCLAIAIASEAIKGSTDAGK